MKTICVASTNPVKIASALRGFQAMFPTETFETCSVSAPSGVSDQPMSDGETLQGAINRVWAAKQAEPAADYWIGIEGGCEWHGGELAAFAWVVVMDGQATGKSRTATFLLPAEVARLIQQGMELGAADDVVFGRANSKQQNGSVGLLTGDVIDRTLYYEHAVILALIPFKQPHLRFGGAA